TWRAEAGDPPEHAQDNPPPPPEGSVFPLPADSADKPSWSPKQTSESPDYPAPRGEQSPPLATGERGLGRGALTGTAMKDIPPGLIVARLVIFIAAHLS